ncbi:ABC transporter permease subunit [Donghicola sp. C2-DW-16]|uniref:ABC transporter permease subunit n=1 Tax=Donghicola mangrovi TaxID=2729614 RepID=A0ABX2PJ21_9RHOB|nr:ABC transporter permease subunit [Donghicola mangrovi]NVO29403.1 ABC transporter permease subunit [Donghicola mangrovi]
MTWVPRLTLAALLLPVGAGLWGVIAPLLGLVQIAGADPDQAVADLLAWPGLTDASVLSITTGFGATLVALLLVVLILSQLHGTRGLAILRRLLSPLLSVPHAAAAFGLAFLIAPSGWIARLFSPWVTGWAQPPDLLILNDPWGIALTLGLAVKEAPFLLLMSLAALGQIRADQSLLIARALGHSPSGAWLKTVFPAVYRQIRLPVYVVLAYSMTVVDVAMILGPTLPTTLSVQILRWMSDPDLSLRLLGAAGALLQLALVIGALAVWWIGEHLIAALGRRWITSGTRSRGLGLLRPIASGLGTASAAVVLTGIAGLLVWSFAGQWSFPDALPEPFTLRNWQRFGPALGAPIQETVIIALTSTLIALLLCIGSLEAEARHNLRPTTRALALLYLPLLVPQIAFLPGLQVLLLNWGLTSGRWVVILSHLVFVIPYVFLSLSDPWRAWDQRYGTVGRALGASPNRVLLRIRLPILLTPILTAAAVGCAVSVGQYLPTLLAGGGRIATLTTEAVALTSGGNRRAIGVYGIAQTCAALIPFAIALTLPRILFRNRRALRPE